MTPIKQKEGYNKLTPNNYFWDKMNTPNLSHHSFIENLNFGSARSALTFSSGKKKREQIMLDR